MTVLQKIVATIAVLVIIGSSYLIYTIIRNEVPATGGPNIPFVDGNFIANDMERITAPVIDENARPTTTQSDEISQEVEVLVENLTIPWGLAFLPNGHLLITERPGNLIDINIETGENEIIAVPNVFHAGEGGLMGLALHPDFENNRYIYLYKTFSEVGRTRNAVVRYVYEGGILTDEFVLVDGIPGALFHDGGRIAFGPDGLLYVTTGDAQNPEFSQDTGSLAGKILRMSDAGGVPPENPFDTLVYSWGHRNPQGLTWEPDGTLWSTEHGRSGFQSGLDELNLIIAGGNYGWPQSQGDTVFSDTIGPTIHSGPDTTWAPASAAYFDGSIFFGGLRGESLYQAVLRGIEVVELREHYTGAYGRIRTVAIGPDNMLYMMTSNRDGRGDVTAGDDKILRVDPRQFTKEQ